MTNFNDNQDTVTVRFIDGKTIQAPAKGPVLRNNFEISEDRLDELAEFNSKQTVDQAQIEASRETARKYAEARELNRKDDADLTRYYDYSYRGALLPAHVRASKRRS